LIRNISTTLDLEVWATQSFFWIYFLVNIFVASVLFSMKRVPFNVVHWVVFGMSLMDGIFLSTLTLVTGGYHSILYWLFLALIVRSAVSIPRAPHKLC
jgi:hypothetical protein